MHKVAGIHKDRLLPLYYRKTFDKWFKEDKAKTREEAPPPKGKVALFYTRSRQFQRLQHRSGVGASPREEWV